MLILYEEMIEGQKVVKIFNYEPHQKLSLMNKRKSF